MEPIRLESGWGSQGPGRLVFVPEVGRVGWDPGPQNGRTSMACLVNGDDPKYTYSLGPPLKKAWSPWKKQVAFFFGINMDKLIPPSIGILVSGI